MPAGTERPTPSSATTPSKRLPMSLTSRSGSSAIAAPPLRYDALRHEQDHQDDEHRDHDHARGTEDLRIDLDKGGNEASGIVEDLDDHRSDQRADEIAGAAKDDHRPDDKGFEREKVFRRDIGDVVRIE